MDRNKIEVLLAFEKYFEAFSFKEPFRTIRRILKNVLPFIKILYSQPETVPCDVLLIDPNYAVQPLLEHLEKRGLHVCRERLTFRNVLRDKMLSEPDNTLPLDLRYYDAVLKYLLRKYQPKVVCSFMDHSLLSPFLKEELHQRGGKYINISHAVSDPMPPLQSMIDFDYYFLFGQSSLRHIEANLIRIGNTKAVLTGSPFITPDFKLIPNYDKKNILYFSQLSGASLYDAPHRKPLIESMEIIITWAKLHPEFQLFIKPHPAENPKFLYKLTQAVSNITVLEKSVSMMDALKDVSLVLNMFSNASIEAALLNRPTVVVNKSGLWHDYLTFDDFFLPRASNVEELHQNIMQTFESYDEALQKTQDFAKFHLEYTTDSIEYIAECIEVIYHGEENFPWVSVSEELSGVRPYMNTEELI